MSEMVKRKIYFVQTGCVFNNEHFLPYASGILAAYCFDNPTIRSAYELSDIIYKCDDFNKTVGNITTPSVIAFSNYMWNFRFNLRLAEKIKNLFPDCIIIFGGHQISDTTEWLEKYPFIDISIFGEGEIILSEILLSLCNNKDLSDIPNISYRNGNGIIKNRTQSICFDINRIPSPYINGIFDSIIENNTDKFAAIIETSRGCPYHCAYCDWGDYNSPVRHFKVERIKQEIEWLGKHSVVFVVLADSNFGIIKSDEDIIDSFVRTKKTYGYPKAVEIAFAKYSPDRVFAMNKKLYENNMSRGATLSMQTLSPEALKNIGRDNMTREKFSKLIKLYSQNNIPAYTELILGLPGETYESFCEGIDYLLDNGQHNSIHVFFCEVLPNAIMNSNDYINKHGIEILKRDFCLRNGISSDGISGESKIIVGTNTMNKEMFLRATIYAFIVQVFHNFGLLRVPALFFHYEKNMKYYEFYNLLIDWLITNNDCFTGKIFEKFFIKYKNCILGKDTDTYENPNFGSTQFNLADGAFLELISSYSYFYKDMRKFMDSLPCSDEIADEIIRFQESIIRKPDNISTEESFEYNWVDYYDQVFKNGKSLLKKEKLTLKILPSPEYYDIISYAQAISIKGRRIGKSITLNEKDAFSISIN